METTGDKDQKTSLRTLEKTDFFTKEIDELQLAGGCRISIHSAKDLPDPLPKGLTMVALTQGVDPSDSLVLRENETIESLPHGAKMGTSSARREKNIRDLRSDFICVDVRGNIQARLALLDQGVGRWSRDGRGSADPAWADAPKPRAAARRKSRSCKGS